jgi:hypothetical protein
MRVLPMPRPCRSHTHMCTRHTHMHTRAHAHSSATPSPATLKVVCRHHGCPWRGDYSAVAAHERSCPSAVSTCPNCGRGVAQRDREQHTLPCLQEQVAQLRAEKARWEVERRSMQEQVRRVGARVRAAPGWVQESTSQCVCSGSKDCTGWSPAKQCRQALAGTK